VKSKHRRDKELPTGPLRGWFERLPERNVIAGTVVWGWPEDAPGWVEAIAGGGPELAYRTGQTWKPAHAAALRRGRSSLHPPTVEVDDDAAWRYWRGHPIECARDGWQVVVHRGRPLGWLKASGGTGKNHLPGAARLNR
jgi:NOL1/NOP2/fmu family ribosome biogenesis protein